jgi:four helix bundle protein
MKYSFEKLDVWQKSRVFAKDIYITTKEFPKSEQFGLTSQLRRASVSVCSNIAEGSGRIGIKDSARFYVIAYSSLIEVLNQLILSNDLEFIRDEDFKTLRSKMEEVSRMLNALHKNCK